MLNAPATTDLDALSTIALEINAIQRRITRDLIRIGELFERARYLLPAGTFLKWCAENFTLSQDTIANYRTVYAIWQQTPEIIDCPPTLIYSMRNAPKIVSDALWHYYDQLPPETPLVTAVVTTRAVAQLTSRHSIDHPGVIDGLMRLPPDDLYAIKATGLIQPGDETDAVSLRDTPEKLLRALDQMQRERVSVAREAVVKLDLYVGHADRMGYVIGGFESEQQAIEWLKRRMK